MNPKPTDGQPDDEPVEITLEEGERMLLAELQDKNADRKEALDKLAFLYYGTGRHDQALGCLRELMALETDPEQKAMYVLKLGFNADKQQNFQAAVRFYREAFAMEPTCSELWYMIHDRLGFSLSKLGHFAEGEKFCRAAVQIDPSQPAGHKNLGIALAGQGKYREAATSFVIATYNNAGDASSLGLLKDLLQQHPELQFDFQSHVDRGEQLVNFAAAAIERSRTGKKLRVLLGTNDKGWLSMCVHALRAMTGGAVDIQNNPRLSGFVETACAQVFDLGLFTPRFLLADQPASCERDAWAEALRAVRRIKAAGRMALVLIGAAEEIGRHARECGDAGADGVLEMSLKAFPLVELTQRLVAKPQPA